MTKNMFNLLLKYVLMNPILIAQLYAGKQMLKSYWINKAINPIQEGGPELTIQGEGGKNACATYFAISPQWKLVSL